MRSITLFLMISVLVILTAGCDPGIEYNPANWSRIRNYEFTKKYDGFDIELRGFQGFTGSTGDAMEGEILNTGNTVKRLYIEKAVLRANNKEYIGQPNYRNENVIHNTKLNERQHFNIYWYFQKPLYEVLKDPVELNLVVKSGDKSVEISVPMVENQQ